MSLTANFTVHELAARLDAGEVTSREVTQACLERIERLDGRIGAFLTVTAEAALAQADAADARRRAGERGPLLGVPVAIRTHVDEGVRTTCASRILENFIPPTTPPPSRVCARPARAARQLN